jgi:TetR/AcrR family transcriptional regulator, transcriptional repressor for nem operon
MPDLSRSAAPAPQPTSSDGTTRGRLTDAATLVFCEKGYEGTTVAEVARRAGLTTGAIYANFRDKAELLLNAIERGTARIVGEMESARGAGATASERMVLMTRRLLSDRDEAEQPLFVEMFAAGRRDAGIRTRVAATLRAMESEVERLVRRAKTDNDVARDWDDGVLARFVLALGVGSAHLSTVGLHDPDPRAWELLTRRVLEAAGPFAPNHEPGG